MVRIHTQRMTLRKLQRTDLDDLVDLDSDPEVMRYLTGGEPTPREAYTEHLLDRMLAWSSDEPLGFYAALLDGTFAGWFHLRPSIAEPTLPELGYRLRRAVWGAGLATEGSLALCQLGFRQLDAPLIDACTVSENAASQAVMRKCGMTWIGEMMHPRVPLLVQRYGVTRAHFTERFPELMA